jgi:hypothetical protein
LQTVNCCSLSTATSIPRGTGWLTCSAHSRIRRFTQFPDNPLSLPRVSLPDETGRLFPCRKFYANNIAFRTELFRTARFPDLDRRTRGAGTLLGKKLEGLGHAVWQNRRALVDHPPPANLRHMIVRALAHGRDIYMKESEERTVRGLVRSQSTAARRLARGYSQTFHSRRRVGLHIWNVPLVLTIISAYYGFFALGGVLTHISPSVMGRLFRL